MTQTLLITGGAGFIGNCFVRQAVALGQKVIILDALTYAGHRENLEGVGAELVVGDIRDRALVDRLLATHKPDALLHFAAESHVDNSIASPGEFIDTNIQGTYVLLEAARNYWNGLPKGNGFRYLQVSTDEVFGALPEDGYFSEASPYAPNSPYSASKAAADLLVRAWHHTYGLPTVTTHCSNNYGPRQLPEKLIPVIITKALSGQKLPIYGDGLHVRDWIHVEDHSSGIRLALEKGKLGDHYCFGGRAEMQNIELVKLICAHLDKVRPRGDGKSYTEQMSFVPDRLGHDRRYAIDDSRAEQELGFTRAWSFADGMKATIDWYLANEGWCQTVLAKKKAA